MVMRILKKLVPLDVIKKNTRRKLFSIKLKETDIAIDCGANVGRITEHLAKSGATVYAFEPNPFAFKELEKKFSDKQNVHCIQKGVLDRNDIRKLYFHEYSDENELYWSGGSSLLDFKGNIRRDKYIEIPVIDLCEFIEKIEERVRLLKLDVEGVECPIVKKLIKLA